MTLPYDLARPIDTNNFVASTEGETTSFGFLKYALTVGEKYLVYGIMSYHNETRYLICDDNSQPAFFPSALFEAISREAMFDWEVAEYGSGETHVLIIAYPALTKEYASLRDLTRLTPKAICDFLSYKESLQNYGFLV